MGAPQLIHVNRIFPYKSTILGYPHLWKPPYKLTNLVPAPIAPPKSLNIVQNGKSSKPGFRSMFMWKSKFQGFEFVGICKKASLFSFWVSGIAVFRTLKENNFLTRDILFEMKSSLSSAASPMLHEANFK
jgi:hypothetical protein